jgi:hypothetical protein
VLFEECGRAVPFRKVVPSRPMFMGRVTELQKVSYRINCLRRIEKCYWRTKAQKRPEIGPKSADYTQQLFDDKRSEKQRALLKCLA